MRKILVSFLICVLLLSTGCLSMIYYPARVLDKGENYVGLGVISEPGYGNNTSYIFQNYLFYRRGLGHGFDIGIGISGYFIWPFTVTTSVRKQFNFSSFIIDGVTLDAGTGYRLNELYGSISLLKRDLSLTFAVAKNVFDDYDGTTHYWLINSAYIRAAYELKFTKHFMVMPYMSYRYSEEYRSYSFIYENVFTSVSETGYDDMWTKNKVGAGVSIVFTF